MNKRLKAHAKMFGVSAGILDKNKPLWQDVIAMVQARTNLGKILESIADEELKQAGSTRGITIDKRVQRRAMCLTAATVAGAVAAWADTQNNHELFATVDFSAPDLLHMGQQDCVTHCKAISAAAKQNVAAMAADASLTDAQITDLDKKIKDFETEAPRPREEEAEIGSATDQLPLLVQAGDRICDRQLDRLMERYKESNPDFYAEYKIGRVIVDPTTHHRPTTTTTTTTTPH